MATVRPCREIQRNQNWRSDPANKESNSYSPRIFTAVWVHSVVTDSSCMGDALGAWAMREFLCLESCKLLGIGVEISGIHFWYSSINNNYFGHLGSLRVLRRLQPITWKPWEPLVWTCSKREKYDTVWLYVYTHNRVSTCVPRTRNHRTTWNSVLHS